MAAIETIINRMSAKVASPALHWQGREYTYHEFSAMIEMWDTRLREYGVSAGVVCGFLGEYSPQVCALIFSLMKAKAILVPFTSAIEHELPEFIKLAGVTCLFRFGTDDTWTFETCPNPAQNNLVKTFSEREVPGLIVFTSGSTGKPKGILQDCERVMHKFVDERRGWRTLLFLMMDHFGGFNTLLSTFAYSGTGICLPDRNPETVCRVIEQSRATLLPVTPTFINLLIASRCYRQYDLSSIKLITYGTEVMPATTLNLAKEIFPNAQIKQTYGLSELGVLRSKSEGDDSVWVQIGGTGFETKIVDDILWIRSEANMVGYLNAPTPFDADGWMCTGDHVEVRGDYMRILGRKSEMINVGGQKVFPSEIENVLLQADNIQDVTVFGVPHPVMGYVVKARISLYEPEEQFSLVERLRKFCMERMARYKVPVKYEIVNDSEHRNQRFKKIRKETLQQE
ncbi:MAG: long-chain fatty acid--CoA ligase [Desulfuromonadaceae bacterium]|nr:long-chain fatty acid--CoA ligase [Desulfuromonadaceae bacterium]